LKRKLGIKYLEKNKPMNNNFYCSKSWTDINIDFENRVLRHCCKTKAYEFPEELTPDFISNNKFIKERRKQSLQGIKHSDCESCWHDYEIGKTAYRDWANKWDSFFIKNTNIDDDDRFIHYVEIKPDRICDMSCIYCSAYSSSKIAQEEKVIYLDKTSNDDYNIFKLWISDFLSRKDLEHSQVIFVFLGGEPTASEKFYELTDFIEQQAMVHTHVTVRLEICTNANSKKFLMNKIIEKMNSSRVNWAIGISNESYGRHAELIRYGLDWERFCENFKLYIQHPKTELIVLSPTINIFNLKTFKDYVIWVFDQFKNFAPEKQFTWYGNFISWPSEMDISLLPISYKKYVRDAEDVFKQHIDNSQWVYKDNFLEFLKQINNRIGQNYTEHFKHQARLFLEKKSLVKKNDKVMDLLETLDLD